MQSQNAIDERHLWRIIDKVSEEYVASKGYGKRRASANLAEDDESLSETTTVCSINEEEARTRLSAKQRLQPFREEAFLPCYMSNADSLALLLLSEALAQRHSHEIVPQIISTIYQSHYGLPLPSYISHGIGDYVSDLRDGKYGDIDWHVHASAFCTMYNAKAWSAHGSEPLQHAALLHSAVQCTKAAEWSTFFHALHCMGALPTSATAERFVKHMGAGGFANPSTKRALLASLESQRVVPIDAHSVIAAASSILKQAQMAVDSVNGDNLAELYYC
jgi:hypothetical protein